MFFEILVPNCIYELLGTFPLLNTIGTFPNCHCPSIPTHLIFQKKSHKARYNCSLS